MGSSCKASVTSTSTSLCPPPNLWAWTKRLNQLFQCYDYDIDKWLQSNLTDSFWLLKLSSLFIGLVTYLIFYSFTIPINGFGDDVFVIASIPFATHLSSISLLIVSSALTLAAYIRSSR